MLTQHQSLFQQFPVSALEGSSFQMATGELWTGSCPRLSLSGACDFCIEEGPAGHTGYLRAPDPHALRQIPSTTLGGGTLCWDELRRVQSPGWKRVGEGSSRQSRVQLRELQARELFKLFGLSELVSSALIRGWW